MKSQHHEMIQCPRETDVLDALASARWPTRVNAELTAHVASCEICQDVIAVASAMQEDHDAAYQEANVPSSGQMWWRAEFRARQSAIREATRPVMIAQGVAVVFALAVAAVVGWFAWPSVQGFFTSFSASSASSAAAGGAQASALASPMLFPIVIAMGALLVVAPIALYVVLSEK